MDEFDVVVWMDDDGDMMTKGFSQAGHECLRSMSEEYVEEPILILCHPDVFMGHMTNGVRVGLRTEQIVCEMNKKHLH